MRALPGWTGACTASAYEDDFRISYSQSYTRLDSQSQQQKTPPQVLPIPCTFRSAHSLLLRLHRLVSGYTCASEMLGTKPVWSPMCQANADASVQAKQLSEGTVGVTGLHGQPAGRHSMTPELVSEEHLIGEHRSGRAQPEEAAPSQRLFPIFRPKSQWKVSTAGMARGVLHQTFAILCQASLLTLQHRAIKEAGKMC